VQQIDRVPRHTGRCFGVEVGVGLVPLMLDMDWTLRGSKVPVISSPPGRKEAHPCAIHCTGHHARIARNRQSYQTKRRTKAEEPHAALSVLAKRRILRRGTNPPLREYAQKRREDVFAKSAIRAPFSQSQGSKRAPVSPPVPHVRRRSGEADFRFHRFSGHFLAKTISDFHFARPAPVHRRRRSEVMIDSPKGRNFTAKNQIFPPITRAAPRFCHNASTDDREMTLFAARTGRPEEHYRRCLVNRSVNESKER